MTWWDADAECLQRRLPSMVGRLRFHRAGCPDGWPPSSRTGHPHPFAVGVMECSSAEAQKSGMKGEQPRNVHDVVDIICTLPSCQYHGHRSTVAAARAQLDQLVLHTEDLGKSSAISGCTAHDEDSELQGEV